MNIEENLYYKNCLAAYLRGRSIRTGEEILPSKDLLTKDLSELTDEERKAMTEAARKLEIKLYPFKNSHDDLPRVRRTLGFLKSVSFESLLDVGSGRGVFLFPFLEAFPWVRVTSLDLLPRRVEFLEDIRRGGMENLTAMKADICTEPIPDKSCDVVTMLEVLEHIPEVEKAVQRAVCIAKKHVVVTVPSKPDDNPEHIHLLTKPILTELFHSAGCDRLRFDGVNGHLFLVATLP